MSIDNDTIITKEHLQIYLNIIGARKTILDEYIKQTKILKNAINDMKSSINKVLSTLSKKDKVLAKEMTEQCNSDLKTIENYLIIFKNQKELINLYEQELIYDLRFFNETDNYKYLADIKNIENFSEEMEGYGEVWKELENRILMN